MKGLRSKGFMAINVLDLLEKGPTASVGVGCFVKKEALDEGSELKLTRWANNQAQEVGSALMQETRPAKVCDPPRLAFEAFANQSKKFLANKPGDDRGVEERLDNGRLLAGHILDGEVGLERLEEHFNTPARPIYSRNSLGVERLAGQIGDVEVILTKICRQ